MSDYLKASEKDGLIMPRTCWAVWAMCGLNWLRLIIITQGPYVYTCLRNVRYTIHFFNEARFLKTKKENCPRWFCASLIKKAYASVCLGSTFGGVAKISAANHVRAPTNACALRCKIRETSEPLGMELPASERSSSRAPHLLHRFRWSSLDWRDENAAVCWKQIFYWGCNNFV